MMTFRATNARNSLRASADAGLCRQHFLVLPAKARHPWLRPFGPVPRQPPVLGVTDGRQRTGSPLLL